MKVLLKAIGRDVDDTKFELTNDFSAHFQFTEASVVSERTKSMLKMMLLVGTISPDLVKRWVNQIDFREARQFLKNRRASITAHHCYLGVEQAYRQRILEVVDECRRDVELRKEFGFKLLTGKWTSCDNSDAGQGGESEIQKNEGDVSKEVGGECAQAQDNRTSGARLHNANLVREILRYDDNLFFGISPVIVCPRQRKVSSTLSSSASSAAILRGGVEEQEKTEDAQ